MSEELLNNPELEENNEGKVEETQVVAETTPEVETPEVMAETPTVTEELPLVETTPVPRKTKTIENAYPSLDDFSWDSIEKKALNILLMIKRCMKSFIPKHSNLLMRMK